MQGRKTLDKIDLVVKSGTRAASQSKILDRGAYSHFQVVKRNTKAQTSPAQIEITDGTDDLVSMTAIEAFNRSGGSYRESMPMINIIDQTQVTVRIVADDAVDTDAIYQVVFYKDLNCES